MRNSCLPSLRVYTNPSVGTFLEHLQQIPEGRERAFSRKDTIRWIKGNEAVDELARSNQAVLGFEVSVRKLRSSSPGGLFLTSRMSGEWSGFCFLLKSLKWPPSLAISFCSVNPLPTSSLLQSPSGPVHEICPLPM